MLASVIRTYTGNRIEKVQRTPVSAEGLGHRHIHIRIVFAVCCVCGVCFGYKQRNSFSRAITERDAMSMHTMKPLAKRNAAFC